MKRRPPRPRSAWIRCLVWLAACSWQCKPSTSGDAGTETTVDAGTSGQRVDATGATKTPSAATTRVLRLAGVEVATLDPARFRSEADSALVLALFEGLLVPPSDDGPPLPGVARGFDMTPDGLHYTFHLRPDARWSDGTAVTARDFVYSWQRAVLPETGSETAGSFYPIRGARELARGLQHDPETLAVRAPDDHTLLVTLEQPAPYFAALVASPAYAPVPRQVVTRQGDRWTRPEHFVGNGAYRLVRHLPREGLVLTKSTTYWDRDSVFFTEIRFRFVTDPEMAYHLFEQGDIDGLNRVIARDRVVSLRKTAAPQLRVDPVQCVALLWFCLKRPPFDEVAVRRAFHLAIDRQQLVEHVLGMGQRPALRPVPPEFGSLLGYPAPPALGFDPPQARSSLAQAGYGGGAGFATVTLSVTGMEGSRLLGEFLAQQWQQNLQVKVEITLLEHGTMLERVQQGAFQMALLYTCAEFSDPLAFLEWFRSDATDNFAGYRSADVDLGLQQAAAEPNAHRRLERLAAAEATILADLPASPLFYLVRVHLLRSDLHGFAPNLRALHPLKALRFAP